VKESEDLADKSGPIAAPLASYFCTSCGDRFASAVEERGHVCEGLVRAIARNSPERLAWFREWILANPLTPPSPEDAEEQPGWIYLVVQAWPLPFYDGDLTDPNDWVDSALCVETCGYYQGCTVGVFRTHQEAIEFVRDHPTTCCECASSLLLVRPMEIGDMADMAISD